MSYLDYARLDALDGEAFRNQKPYPWVNPEGALTAASRRSRISCSSRWSLTRPR